MAAAKKNAPAEKPVAQNTEEPVVDQPEATPESQPAAETTEATPSVESVAAPTPDESVTPAVEQTKPSKPNKDTLVQVRNTGPYGFTQPSTGLRIGGKAEGRLAYDGWVELNVQAGLFELVED